MKRLQYHDSRYNFVGSLCRPYLLTCFHHDANAYQQASMVLNSEAKICTRSFSSDHPALAWLESTTKSGDSAVCNHGRVAKDITNM